MQSTIGMGALLILVACGDSTRLGGASSIPIPLDDETLSHRRTDAPKASTLALPEPSHTAFLWQGMDHLWLRDVAGFQVPHRISLLESLIANESFEQGRANATFSFGQSTGVDGNYMKPVGRWAMFDSPDVVVLRNTHEFSGTDAISGGEYPEARVSHRAELKMALPVGVDSHDLVATSVIQGFAFESACDPKKQPADNPCNSNGAWPVEFDFGVSDCAIVDRNASCIVTFEFARGWTPQKGGIPGIEEKPLNEKLDYRLKIAIATVVGKREAFLVNEDSVSATGAIHDKEPSTSKRSVSVQKGMSAPTVVLSGLGFRLFKTLNDEKANHLGRYIGGLNFGLVNSVYDSSKARFSYDTSLQVWSPQTVQASGVAYSARTRVMQFLTASTSNGVAEGALCINSSPSAPMVSAWERCGTGSYVAERDRDSKSISIVR